MLRTVGTRVVFVFNSKYVIGIGYIKVFSSLVLSENCYM
jgi:hypothetical protein